ncbi:GspH/FimT family pseudopilin [Nitrincola sp. MINF-07-Sa-05]|uniref:GspH/FimT family pseudopilin n=1 Tax=Nitrincola salilacus TaxID=3400273 RepID=UPI00391850F3
MEVMITISIAAIILGLGIPSFQSMITKNRIVSQTNEIIGLITTARSEAIRRNSTVTLCRTTSANTTQCAENTATWEHWLMMLPNGSLIQRGDFSRYNNAIVTSGLTADRIRFQADGLARTGTDLVSGNRIRVNSTHLDNCYREIVLGAGNRQSIDKDDATGCL